MSTMSRPESSFLSTLPGRYYYDPAIYDQELEKIFSRLWVCVGRAEVITEVGAYMTVQVGQENVIVVRGRDGELRAFLNVCRHRGARLCSEDDGQTQRINSVSLSCLDVWVGWALDWCAECVA